MCVLGDGGLGRVLLTHHDWPGWDIITELPGENILFYDRTLRRAQAYRLLDNGGIGDLVSVELALPQRSVHPGAYGGWVFSFHWQVFSHTGRWRQWDVITPLPGGRLLFYS